MMKLSAIAILLTACGVEGVRDIYCGESFCISGISSREVIKTSPVEDFNLYQIRFMDRDFTIYEGNNPEIIGNLVRNVPLTMNGATATLLRSDNEISVQIQIGGRQWPTQLVIHTACEAPSECDIIELVNRIEAPHS